MVIRPAPISTGPEHMSHVTCHEDCHMQLTYHNHWPHMFVVCLAHKVGPEHDGAAQDKEDTY